MLRHEIEDKKVIEDILTDVCVIDQFHSGETLGAKDTASFRVIQIEIDDVTIVAQNVHIDKITHIEFCPIGKRRLVATALAVAESAHFPRGSVHKLTVNLNLGGEGHTIARIT